mgnify:CR=1 FL=1
MYKVFFTKQAVKDLEKLKQAGISSKAKLLKMPLIRLRHDMRNWWEILMGLFRGE